MARTESTMVELGTGLPTFTLPEPLTGRSWSDKDLKGPLVVMFLCNHCPYVVHVLDPLLELTREYTARGIQFVAINANDGLARALRVTHAPFDGDTVFVAATGARKVSDPVNELTEICAIAADCLARAIARGVYEATALPFPGALPAWSDIYRGRG